MNEEQVIAGALPGAVQRVEATSIKPKQRRRHSAQFRQHVIGEASQPGVRVASVARAHDLDVGLVRRWAGWSVCLVPRTRITPTCFCAGAATA